MSWTPRCILRGVIPVGQSGVDGYVRMVLNLILGHSSRYTVASAKRSKDRVWPGLLDPMIRMVKI